MRSVQLLSLFFSGETEGTDRLSQERRSVNQHLLYAFRMPVPYYLYQGTLNMSFPLVVFITIDEIGP